MKPRLKYVLPCVILLVIAVIFAALYKIQKKIEGDYITLATGLKNKGEKALSNNEAVAAFEYYSNALKWTKKTKLWSEKNSYDKELSSILNRDYFVKIAQGLLLLDGSWVKKQNFSEINARNRKIEGSTKDQLANSMLNIKNKDWDNGSKSLYFVIKQIQMYPWLSSSINDNDILQIYNKFPPLHTTPLHLASQSQDIESALYLLKQGVNVNALDVNNHSPTFYAIKNNNIKLLDIYLQNGADYDQPFDNMHIMEYAIIHQNVGLLQLLIRHGANLNKQYISGYPLGLCVQLSNIELVEYLLSVGANPNVIDKFGLTPLSYAYINKFESGIKLLVKQGVDQKHIKEHEIRKIPLSIIKDTQAYKNTYDKSIQLQQRINAFVTNLAGPDRLGMISITPNKIDALDKLYIEIAKYFSPVNITSKNIHNVLISATASMNYFLGYLHDENSEFNNMLLELTNIARKYNYRVKLLVTARSKEIILVDPVGKELRCSSLTNESPFIFNKGNYNLMIVLPRIPNFAEAITLELYYEELKKIVI